MLKTDEITARTWSSALRLLLPGFGSFDDDEPAGFVFGVAAEDEGAVAGKRLDVLGNELAVAEEFYLGTITAHILEFQVAVLAHFDRPGFARGDGHNLPIDLVVVFPAVRGTGESPGQFGVNRAVTGVRR